MPRELVKHYFWVCLWGFLWKRLASESVGRVKKIILTNMVDIIQPIVGLKRTKRQRKGKFTLSVSAKAAVFPCPQTLALLVLRRSGSDRDLYHQLLWFSNLWIWTEIHHWISWFSSFQMAHCRTSWSPQPLESILIINLLIIYLSIYLSI